MKTVKLRKVEGMIYYHVIKFRNSKGGL